MKKLAGLTRVSEESSVDNGAQRDARHLARAARPDVMSDEGIVKNSLKGQKGDGLGDDKVYSNQEVRAGIRLLAQLGRTTLTLTLTLPRQPGQWLTLTLT